MKKTRRSIITMLILAVFISAIGIGTVFGAGPFPEKPITIVVHASAGGGSDMFARMIAQGIQNNKILPQPIIIENKPGGSGAIAYAYVAGKAKDPYFMLTATPPLLTTPIMGLTPVSLKDFTPISNLAYDELVLSVSANSKYKSIKDVLIDAKANPKKILLAINLLGGPDSMCAAMVEKAAGVQFNPVIFNGQKEADAALLGNHVDISIGNPGGTLDLARAGKLRVLGIFSNKRMTEAPDIPTMKEQGLDVVFQQNRGIVAPAGIPAEARKILSDALYKYTQTDIFKNYCKHNLLTEGYLNADDFEKYLNEWNGKYAVILKDMNLIKKK